MADESGKKQEVPELEPRRGSTSAVPTDAGRRSENVRESEQSGLPPIVDEHARQRMAIYLIEREAIALRRQRWVDVLYGKESAATKAGAGRPVEPERARSDPQADVTDAERLQQYARPTVEVSDARQTRGGRARAWVTSLFRM